MSTEKETIARGIYQKASEEVLNKETLTLDDVRKFVVAEYRSQKLINEVYDIPEKAKALKVMDGNIRDWYRRRDMILPHLLAGMTLHRVAGESDLEEASYRCLLTLVEFPLIESRSVDGYKAMVEGALTFAQKAILRRRSSEDMELFNANFAAVLYNTRKFCPESVHVDYFADTGYAQFLQHLDALRGIGPKPIQ